MNLLSHFYFEKDESPEFIFGLALPDLARNYNQSLRKKINHSEFKYPFDLNVKKGILQHFSHDQIFHQSDFFDQISRYIDQTMKLPVFDFKRSRPFLLKHIYAEMLMDRILMIQEKELGKDFYSRLDQLDKNALHQFFERIDAQAEAKRFFAIFNTFLSARFLLNYTDNDFFIKALIRTYSSVISYIQFSKKDIRLLEARLEQDTWAMESKVMRFFNKFEF